MYKFTVTLISLMHAFWIKVWIYLKTKNITDSKRLHASVLSNEKLKKWLKKTLNHLTCIKNPKNKQNVISKTATQVIFREYALH